MDYYDYEGHRITMSQWAGLFENRRSQIATSEMSVGDKKVVVSTVWLGIDPIIGGGPPMIFETMVFGGAHDEVCARYATLEQARAGHQVMCDLVTAEETA